MRAQDVVRIEDNLLQRRISRVARSLGGRHCRCGSTAPGLPKAFCTPASTTLPRPCAAPPNAAPPAAPQEADRIGRVGDDRACPPPARLPRSCCRFRPAGDQPTRRPEDLARLDGIGCGGQRIVSQSEVLVRLSDVLLQLVRHVHERIFFSFPVPCPDDQGPASAQFAGLLRPPSNGEGFTAAAVAPPGEVGNFDHGSSPLLAWRRAASRGELRPRIIAHVAYRVSPL